MGNEGPLLASSLDSLTNGGMINTKLPGVHNEVMPGIVIVGLYPGECRFFQAPLLIATSQ